VTTSIILDVDTGIDDALALMTAVRHPDLDVRAITCVAGNVALPAVVANTHAVLDLAGAGDVPVAAGADRPLVERPRDASHMHGADGLGNAGLPASTREVSSMHAVELMRRVLNESADPVTIVALAPMTNLALLLRTYPEVADRIERVVFMGGSASVGNATASAEFNVWHDPEAASIVLNSGVPATMYGLDVFTRVAVPEPVVARLQQMDDPLARAVGGLLGYRAQVGITDTAALRLIGDAGAVCALAAPHLVRTETWPVQVDLAGLSRGQTIVDRRSSLGEDAVHGRADPWPEVEVTLDVEVAAMVDFFLQTLGCAEAAG